jgi:hypothetical protein
MRRVDGGSLAEGRGEKKRTVVCEEGHIFCSHFKRGSSREW